ncbi:MAG: hypothetical protein COX90_02665 [Candidatus Nealsonbacteria bacterium CG_4_10_14_0_2_um_filter_38_17]|uniref:Uncharacterized protein n=2 Tax=Candidatus Nealsoniibacteriota TaxID=1817911 RepID=A0A2M7UXT9_9BACT|nr:MAG: hypothetical protein COX36_02285 [Candidatus Nealsonbacteria bacterium CG23_combo_of_CG06-09_8_20_14_all_38_19]PIZ88803.1 MAG: hypothetical protein COX90_02665 [Candidatus Nealsonbacteria bacterium CG_4_10_14_0_2_um_filter_38_17]
MVTAVEDAAAVYEEFCGGDPVLWQKYDRCCVNLEGIKRKLANGVPAGKKGALEFQQRLLSDRVIPQVIVAIQQTRI